MSTRSGDLDPGLAPYLERTEQMTTKQYFHMVNHESGLLGYRRPAPICGLNDARNAAHASVISADASRVTVCVIRTDEELMIARSVCRVLGLGA